YSPLNSDPSVREIRLLHLQPGAWKDPIQGTLDVVSLSKKPKYQALSYVWGDPTNRKPISIDGELFLATQYLFNALQRIRHPWKQLYLWVDAVCINQDDLHERQNQVAIMGEIYNGAEEVL
ncbi:HET-domain-containing protein, partial [Sporormia fimetaria CBS 119925]